MLLGCSPSARKPLSSSAASSGSNQVFQVKGVVKELQSDGKTVVIRHEEVPNYMPAMTMPFTAKQPRELAGLNPGDQVEFRMTVTENDVWIDEIRKAESSLGATNSSGTNTVTAPPNASAATGWSGTNSASANQLPPESPFRIVRDVDPLQIGDKLPEYHFTNELGQAVSTADFKGQALAITFIFTRCPLPNFCPRMSSNFEDVQRKLLGMTNGPANWHLLTISFDPEFDKPVILKAYAERYKADPKHWSFLMSDVATTAEISDQFGQRFWKEEGAINHNLRTAVIDAGGRVQQIFQGNLWTTDDLVAEMVKAAGDH
jgi:protein SCO1/2